MTFLDANRWQGDAIRADVAIVGAGAAGLALAREFTGRAVQVALIEGGDFQPEPVHVPGREHGPDQ